MNKTVLSEVTLRDEPLTTIQTLVRLHTTVSSHVTVEGLLRRKTISTLFTNIRC